MSANEVWVGESGDYEQRGITGVYASVEDAVDCTKARCAQYEGYEWGEVTEDRGIWTLHGTYWGTVRVEYDFTRYEIERRPVHDR